MLLGYVLMCLIFGTTYLMIKVGLQDGMPPFLFAGLRFFIAAVIVLAFLVVRKQITRLTFREYRDLAVSGFMMTTIPFAALFWGEQYISSGTAALLVATAPIFTTLVSIYFKQIQFRWYVLIGLLVSVSGAGLIVGNHLAEEHGLLSLLSKLFIVASELFFAIGAVYSRKHMTKLSPFAFNGYQMLFASAGLLVMSVCFEQPASAQYSLQSLLSLFYLSVAASIIASTIYYWLVKETNATFPTTWTYVAPVIAMLIGAFYLGEQLTPLSLFGAVSVLAGIILLNWETWVSLSRKNTLRPASKDSAQ